MIMTSTFEHYATPIIKNILLTHKKYNYTNKIPDLENTKESQELLKLERKLAKNLLAIIKYMFNKEQVQASSTIKPRIADLKRKYGFLFATVLRSSIEEIYRLGGSYGIKFQELPSITYFTTESDLVLIRQYTNNYHQRIWHRIDKFVLNRVPVASPIKGSFIVNTLAAELANFVMMKATKEKTRQVISILDKNNTDPFLTVENASTNDESSNRENYTAITKKERDTVGTRRSTNITESAASMNPVLGYGPESISALLAIKGYSEIKENTDFDTIFDYVTDDAFFSNVMTDRYFFMWQTARDDKVCKKYCRPLDGVIWTLKEINVIPLPDQLTHPFCRCRIIKVRI